MQYRQKRTSVANSTNSDLLGLRSRFDFRHEAIQTSSRYLSGTTRWLIAAAVCVVATFLPAQSVNSEEPAKAFLEKLVEQQLYDLGQAYLDECKANGLLPDDLAENYELEKLYLLQDSIGTIRNPDEQLQVVEQVKNQYQAFLKTQPNHPRNNEARMKLADLYLSQVQLTINKIESDDTVDAAELDVARNAANDARSLFEQSITELAPQIQAMQGGRVQQSDTAGLLKRKELENQYRQAEILKALAAKFLAETYADDAAESKTWLTTAEKELSELIKKTTGASEAGRHTLGLLYRGAIQAKLGKVDEAYDSLIRVADIDAGGMFRMWRAQATADLVRLYANDEQKKYAAILPRAELALQSMQDAERFEREWIDLQFAFVEGNLAWAEALASEPREAKRAKQIEKEARSLLKAMSRRRGPQQPKAKILLASLGFENNESDPLEEIPDIKTLEEAIAAARKRIQSAEDAALTMQINTTGDADPDAIAAAKESSQTKLNDAITIIRQGLSLAAAIEDTVETRDEMRAEISDARYLMAFAMLRAEQYWEAAATGQFLTETALGSDAGLKASEVTLIAYRGIIESLPPEKQMAPIAQLESLVQRMLTAWPDSDKADQWVLTLLATALKTNSWDDAERYLNMLPESSSSPDAYRRELGFIMITEARIAESEARRTNASVDPSTTEKRNRAVTLLEQGISSLSKDQLDQRAVQATNALAAVRLESEQPNDAIALLERPEVGSLPIVRSQPAFLTDPNVALETLRIYLQSLVLAASKNNTPIDVSGASAVITEMQSIADGVENGNRRVAAALVLLGRDLDESLKTANTPAEKSNLTNAMSVLLGQLANVSNDPQTLYWAGSSMMSTAEQVSSNPALKPQVEKLNQAAALAFQRLKELGQSNPAALAAANIQPAAIELKLAISEVGKGDYKSAIEKLTSAILADGKANLTAQIEIAKAYQAWGKQTQKKDPILKAMSGAEPKGRSNQVWGWGKIAQIMAAQMQKKPSFTDYFLQARLHIAECRLDIADIETDPAKKKSLYKKALGDIRSTYSLYTDLVDGNPIRADYESTTRKIQKFLNEKPLGLAGIK